MVESGEANKYHGKSNRKIAICKINESANQSNDSIVCPSSVGPRAKLLLRHTLLPFHPSSKGRNHALRRYRRAIRREEGALDDKYSLMDGYSACREIILRDPFVAVSSATNPNSLS